MRRTKGLRVAVLVLLALVGAHGVALRSGARVAARGGASEGSGSAAHIPSEFRVLDLYPLPPSPASASPPAMPFANVDFDREPLAGAMVVPPVPANSAGSSEGSGSSDGAGSSDAVSLAGEGLPFETPPMDGAPSEQRVEFDVHWLRRDSANPYCEMCKEVMNVMNENSGAAGDELCAHMPERAKRECGNMATMLRKNADVQFLLHGCVDKTGPLPIPKEQNWLADTYPLPYRTLNPEHCPGLVACNIVEAEDGGPICGKQLRSWGDFIPRRAYAPAHARARALLHSRPPPDARQRVSRPTPWNAYPRALQVRPGC